MLSYAFTTIFMCFLLLMRTVFVNFAYWNSVLVWLHSLCCILFSSFRSCWSALLFVQFTRLCLFHTLVPCCSAAESFALDLRHIRIRIIFCWTCCSASNLNLRRTTHLFSTIVVTEVVGRLFCLFGLLRVLFTRVLENFGCGFCILRSGIQRHAHPRCTCTCFADAA